MSFVIQQSVMFRHCDPAGIVFYPRYFEMFNDTVEAFFETIPGQSFAQIHPNNGQPTFKIEAEFHAPSRHGEVLDLSLGFTKIGRTSLSTLFQIHYSSEKRMTARSILVRTNAKIRPEPWPQICLEAFQPHLLEDIE